MKSFFYKIVKVVICMTGLLFITQSATANDVSNIPAPAALPDLERSLAGNQGAFLIVQTPANDQKVAKLAINEKFYLKINGIEQYLMIKGENLDNPVLLYLHGGPGLSGMGKEPLIKNWEKLYTVVYWDQRGAGKTFEKNHRSRQPLDEKEKPTIANMLEDTRQLVQYLKTRFHKDKIVILGHSWGSVLGSEFVLNYPHDVAYYIGVGQVTNAYKDERVVYEYLYNKVKTSGNKEDLATLESIADYPYYKDENKLFKDLILVRTMQAKYHIINMEIKQTPESQQAYHKNGPVYSNIYKYMMNFDLYKTPDYAVPVYYILGMHDWQVPTVNAVDYFYKINAPAKGLFLIPDAGHSTMTDQPVAFYNALKVVREGK